MPKRGSRRQMEDDPSRGLSRRAKEILAVIEKEGFVDLRRAAQIYHRRPRPYTERDPAFLVKKFDQVYQMLARLEARGMVAVPVHLRPKEWHRVFWTPQGPPYIANRLGGVVLMCTKHQESPLFLKTKGQVWRLPNPVRLVPAT